MRAYGEYCFSDRKIRCLTVERPSSQWWDCAEDIRKAVGNEAYVLEHHCNLIQEDDFLLALPVTAVLLNKGQPSYCRIPKENWPPDDDRRHIIYVAPYNSILEQNAEDIRKAVGNEAYVLEHHCNLIQEEENWPPDETILYTGRESPGFHQK